MNAISVTLLKKEQQLGLATHCFGKSLDLSFLNFKWQHKNNFQKISHVIIMGRLPSTKCFYMFFSFLKSFISKCEGAKCHKNVHLL